MSALDRNFFTSHYGCEHAYPPGEYCPACGEVPDLPDDLDGFDEWANAGRYLPHMLYPTLRADEEQSAGGRS